MNPITLEVIQERLISIVREMRATLSRVAYSSVLNEARPQADGSFKPGDGLLDQTLASQFGSSSLFDIAPLRHSIQSALAENPVEIVVVIIAVVMVIIMTASQFITQLISKL